MRATPVFRGPMEAAMSVKAVASRERVVLLKKGSKKKHKRAKGKA